MSHFAPSRFEPMTIAQRGKLSRMRAEVQQRKPEHGETRGSMRCACGATLHFTIQSTGISYARCSAACGVKWSQ